MELIIKNNAATPPTVSKKTKEYKADGGGGGGRSVAAAMAAGTSNPNSIKMGFQGGTRRYTVNISKPITCDTHLNRNAALDVLNSGSWLPPANLHYPAQKQPSAT